MVSLCCLVSVISYLCLVWLIACLLFEVVNSVVVVVHYMYGFGFNCWLLICG